MSEISVVCAIIEENSRILAAKRGPNGPQPGLWEFPGGKIRSGEDSKQALTREIREELGITIAVGKQFGVSTYRYDRYTVKLTALSCTIIDGTPCRAEHEEIRWIAPREALELRWAPADLPLLNKYVESRK